MKKKIIFSIFLIIILMIGITTKVEASYTASNQTVKSGGDVSITVTSTEKLENFDVTCTDTGGLTYKSCSSSVTGAVANSSSKTITYAAIGGEAKTLGTYKFTAPKVTTKTKYTVKFDVDGTSVSSTVTVNPEATTTNTNTNTNTNTTGGNSASTNTNTTTDNTTTKEAETKKSNNANLKTLGVTPKQYDFSGFKKTTTSYSVTIPNNIDSLNVIAKAEDSKAKVKITGNSGFEVGSGNKIKVVVTAEDGTTKTYTIKVTKLAEDGEKPGNIIDDDIMDVTNEVTEDEEEKEELYLTQLSISGIELSPEFSDDVYSYKAYLTDMEVTELKVEAKANNIFADIEITGNKDLKHGANIITITLTADDSETATYTIKVIKQSEEERAAEIAEKEAEAANPMNILGSLKKYLGLGIAFVVLVIVAIIVLIVLLKKENRRIREEKKTNEYDDELSEQDKETMAEINAQTEKIFKDTNKEVQGQSVEYNQDELYSNPLEGRKKGRHF